MSGDETRGSGRTVAQMRQAPRGAVFLARIKGSNYITRMARWLHRHDMVIMSPKDFRAEMLNGLDVQVVVDHSVIIPLGLVQMIDAHNRMVAPAPGTYVYQPAEGARA